MKMERIATVKATGDRYIVQRIDFPKAGGEPVVHCWGELTGFDGRNAKHAAALQFAKKEVEITEVARTPALLRALVEQMVLKAARAGLLEHRTRHSIHLADGALTTLVKTGRF